MRIFFVNPNAGGQVGFSYGIASLSAVLKQAGHRVSVLNINEKMSPVPEDSEIINDIFRFKPDLIGFSIVTLQFPYALRLAKAIKEKKSRVPVIAGGVHATMVPEEILKTKAFDYVCVGEGEFSLLALIDAMERGEDTGKISGIWKRINDKIISNPVGPFPELSVLPKVDYTICDFQHLINVKKGWVSIMAGRGCPFMCSYCFNHRIVDRYRKELCKRVSELRYVRFYPPQTVVSEISHLATMYSGVKMLIFDDDIFTLNKNYVREFCTLYRESQIQIPLTVNAHVRFFDEETAKSLAEAGCKIVKFGLESGSSRIRREVLRRYMSNSQIEKAFGIAHKYSLHSSAFLMLGLPKEKKEDMLATVNLLGKIMPGRFRWSVFYPFPGTVACEIAEKEGFINPQKTLSLTDFFSESPLDFGEEMNLFLDKLNTAFPWFVNAYSVLGCASMYKSLVDEIEKLPKEKWEQRKHLLVKEDAEISAHLTAEGKEHYAIKYNRFMGVNSKFFSIKA
ncbi:MAG: radical SAM protein [Planctomycetota bacterium]